ncbi:hypothetical protein [Streptomyces hirsutus]|uniref:hypothetical protein n=1 Tax=Streptomyces hirsutus TaxID=35620 RepID=UPI003697F58C
MRRTDPRLQIITETIERLIPGATPAFLSVDVTETLPGPGERRNSWTGTPAGLAERVFTALFGRPQTGEQQSPLARAEDAKRARDLGAEIAALQQGHTDLMSAPWYPARPGDLVHVHYEQSSLAAAFGETYLVSAGADGFLSMQLLCHTLPDGEDRHGMVGCYAVDDDPNPLMEIWFEVGPHRLTIIRDGRVVHDGAARSSRSVAAAGPSTTALTLAAAMCDAEDYLERGEPELALARLQSDKPLLPCGTPGPMPEHADCARPRGHRPPCSPDADYVEPPHECPALPEQLHAVLTVDSKATHVHLAGLYADRDHAVDHASGYAAYREDHTDRYVKPAPGLPGEAMLELPLANELQAVGVQLAVVVPLPVLPDPRAEDEYAAEGMATALDSDDYADDYRDLDE